MNVCDMQYPGHRAARLKKHNIQRSRGIKLPLDKVQICPITVQDPHMLGQIT